MANGEKGRTISALDVIRKTKSMIYAGPAAHTLRPSSPPFGSIAVVSRAGAVVRGRAVISVAAAAAFVSVSVPRVVVISAGSLAIALSLPITMIPMVAMIPMVSLAVSIAVALTVALTLPVAIPLSVSIRAGPTS